MKVTLIALSDIRNMAVSAAYDVPEAKALAARVEEIVAYANGHILRGDDAGYLGEDNPHDDPKRVLEQGRLRCVFFRAVVGGKVGKILRITLKGLKSVNDLPPPVACGIIAKMFGFRGTIQTDYQASVRGCSCGSCGETLFVECSQADPS